jgi:hypothetical protein
VATSWFIDAVMETASLQSLVLIEAEDTQTLRSGCVEERTRPTHQACTGSAEREAVQARHPEYFGCAGSRSGKSKSSPFLPQPARALRNSEVGHCVCSANPSPASFGIKAVAQVAPPGTGLPLSAKRCLTPHSSRAPTASHRAGATVQVCFYCSVGPAPSRWCRLSSNVRRRNSGHLELHHGN